MKTTKKLKNVKILKTKIAYFAGNQKGMKGFDTVIFRTAKGEVYECSWGLNIQLSFVLAHPDRLFMNTGLGSNYELIFKKSIL